MQGVLNVSEQGCIFCKIVAGQAPSHLVWEDLYYMAFLSIYPNTEGLTVVIPKRHLSSYIFDHASEVVQGLMGAAKEVADLLVGKFLTVARVAVVFEGYGVNHLHAKLIPLHGTKDHSWRKAAVPAMPTTFEVYPGYISSHDAARASDEKLAVLAQFLRG